MTNNFSLKYSDSLDADILNENAKSLSNQLLPSSVLAILITIFAAWQSGIDFIYYYTGIFVFSGVINVASYFLIRNNRRVLGIALVQFGVLITTASIVFNFVALGLGLSLIAALLTWQISYLTLEQPHRRRGLILGVVCAVIILLVDLYWPYPRLRVSAAVWGTYLVGGGLALAFIVLFFRNFANYSIQTKLVAFIVGLALITTVVELILLVGSTREILTNQTQVEIGLRGERIGSEVVTQIERQADRLQALGTNQVIANQISADIADLEDLETSIIELILARRNEVWINSESDFTLNRHFPFFLRLRNPVADLLRDYRQNFPETEQLLIINQYGSVVAMSSRSDAPQYLFNETDWWQQIIGEDQNTTYVGNPLSLPDDTLGIPVAVPIQDLNNNLIGVIYSVVSANQLILSLGLDEAQSLDTNFSLIIDNETFLPLVPGQNAVIPAPLDAGELTDLMAMDFGQTQSIQGNDLVTAIPIGTRSNQTNILPSQWGIFVSRPLAVLESIIVDQIRIQVLTGIAIVLGAGLLAGLIARAISSPIISLAGVAKRLESGELSARTDIESLDEIGSLGVAFNQMAEQSQRLVNQLETRVAERTQALETSFKISQTISSITDKQELVSSVVNQLQAAFDYYHAQIYLLDESKEQLQLAAGSGEQGHRLMGINHSLAMGQGLVGRTAVSKMPVIVPDVSQDLQWVPNRFLPDTKSELAVPILLEQEVLGVIDVQDDEINTLTEREAGLLRSIADQVAVALRNADQIERERERADREEKINAIREKIFKTQDIESAMKTAVKEIGMALGQKSTVIQLKNEVEEGRKALGRSFGLSESEIEKAKVADLTPDQHTQNSKQSKNGINGHKS
ncbi:MAG: GAF domain-containing protein [Chloroflexota bacterium]